MKPLIYDIEIENAIQSKNEPLIDGVSYCKGWQDHANMGISCICAYDYETDRYRVFTRGNFDAFIQLAKTRYPLVGFNNIAFDNKVIDLHLGFGIREDQCYDLLREIWLAAGLSKDFQYPSHTGYGLDAVCEVNFGKKKTGNGALAPVDWQRGEYGKVIDYCINDVKLTKELFDFAVIQKIAIQSPKAPGEISLLTLAQPVD